MLSEEAALDFGILYFDIYIFKFRIIKTKYHKMDDQVVAEEVVFENEEDESLFQDVDMLQSHGIVSIIHIGFN